MSLEAKVGAFVLSGLLMLGTAIFLLGDFSLERRYPLYVTFHDVANLTMQTPVKLSGVEIGQVKDIQLVDSKARVILSIRRGVKIYRDAEFEIGSTGIIGSKYLQIDQGHPEAGIIEAGSELAGTEPVSIEKALTKALSSLQNLMGDLTADGPRGSLTSNLKDTVANVREMTANLNDLIAETKPQLTSAVERTDSITKKLDDLLAKGNLVMADLATGKGAVGALLHDDKVKEDVKITISNVKEAAGTMKDVFGRINQFRVFWNYDWRYDSLARTSHSDIGIFIYPREGKYYYLGGANLANISDRPRSGAQSDYTQANKVDALLGWQKGPIDAAFGVIRSAGGARLTYTPFYQDSFWKRVSLQAQGYDFGRNRTIAGRVFDKPAYDAGLLINVHKYVSVGARVESIAEVPRVMTWAKVMFEDNDLSYLFGLATFGAAGTKGRSKSSQ